MQEIGLYRADYADNLLNMEVTLKRRIASRGWHVYGKTVWKEPKSGESVFAEKETNEEALLADKFSVAWKRKLKTKLTADVVGHVPREISRAVWHFITHGGVLNGKVYSPAYFPSPIATRGLEILIDCEFKIDASKLIILQRMQEITDKNYKEPVSSCVEAVQLQNPADLDLAESKDSDSDVEIIFTNDEDPDQVL